MKTLKIFAFNLALLFVLLFCAEWFLGEIRPGMKGSSSLLSRCVPLREAGLPNERFWVKPSVYEIRESDNLTAKPCFIEMDSNGFIMSKTKHPAPAFQIVFLGGSTTKCAFMDDSVRFPSLVADHFLKAGLPVNTFNGGEAGNHTLNCLNMLVNKCLYNHYQVVVLMEAINDVSSLSYFQEYYSTDERFAKRNISTSAHMDSRHHNFTFSESYSLKFRIKKGMQLFYPNIYGGLFNLKASFRNLQDIPEFEEMTPILLQERQFKEYENNLTTFVAICRANGIKPVLMTQFNRIVESELSGNKAFKNYLDKLSKLNISIVEFCTQYRRMNEIVRKVAAQENVMLIDLDKHIPKEKTYIYDMVHLTPVGSQLVAAHIFEELNHKFSD